MKQYVAFLSGLPVGRHPIGMTELSGHFRKLGFQNVRTYLTTGNVTFETAPVGNVPSLEAQVSRHLTRSLGADITTFIRTPEELGEITSSIPFTEAELGGERNVLFIVFLAEPLDEITARRLRVLRNESDLLRPARREIYWLRCMPDDASAKPLSLTDVIDTPVTVRSFKTIRHLAAKPPSKRATVSVRSRP